MALNCNPVQGMRDLLPDEVELRRYVTDTILDVYKKYGFTQIETPCTEHMNFLTGGDGGENEKMLFKILKRGEKLIINEQTQEKDLCDIGLRFDLTVPLSRYYAINREKLPRQFKAIQTGSVWRAERPQKGRYRQFTQCDIDIIGVKGVIAETELIMATSEALLNLSFTRFVVKINDRRILESLAEYCGFPTEAYGNVFIILDKLDKIGVEGVRKELEKAGYAPESIETFLKITAQSAILTTDELPEVLPNLSENVLQDLQNVTRIITLFSEGRFNIQFDISLVRGMGYYTGQIFEVAVSDFGSSIAGGGRYDKMIGKMLGGKEEIPACGFSIGFERVIMLLTEMKFQLPQKAEKIVILYPEETDILPLMETATWLRTEGKIVLLEAEKKNRRKQLEDCRNQGYSNFAIYTENQPLELRENQ